MPLMGIDWSQTGVTHLFSAIKVCHTTLCDDCIFLCAKCPTSSTILTELVESWLGAYYIATSAIHAI